MRQYFKKFEHNNYLEPGTPGHGFDGFLATTPTDAEEGLLANPERLSIFESIARTLGYNEEETFDRMRRDVNSINPNRDSQTGLFNFPFHNTANGTRTNANRLLQETLDAHHPLTIQLESLVTKILFDDSLEDEPRAIGVEYLQGKSLYRADPRSQDSELPEAQRVFANKGVVISGGVFNTPQILKLSGIGPAEELEQHGIPVVVDLPGVGANLQDDAEISLAAYASVDLSGPPPEEGSPECTLGVGDDPCVDLWREGRGPYTQAGATHGIHMRSSVAENNERDLVFWNPPDVFRGFFPGYSRPQGDPNTTFNFAMVHSQSRNQQGDTVTLRSADPRDVPDIFFNFWGQGSEEDLQAMYEGIEFAREALAGVAEPVGPFMEFQPCNGPIGAGNCTMEATKDFIRHQVYSHHASSTAAIGADDDPMAVLHGDFRVRGTHGLRVVDGSALPRVPSPFPIVGQFMASFKAAHIMIEEARVGKC